MAVKSKMTRNSAKQWIGQPVCIELMDGRSYIGWVTEAESGQLVLSGQRIPNPADKATISGLFPGMLGSMVGGGGSMFGGGGGGLLQNAGSIGKGLGGGILGGGFGSIGGIMGFMGNAFPMIKMGYGMIKSIMPMLKMFNI
ncbi:hypothetical protein A8990_13626 [Paenibacillus taihuensis]|uniref:LSM domain-containing protein n=1 Tax=Paenibacillus taihuensis TaxID=1156355 RepID=A0A3D9QX14_9BACL|nr:hypothetical protein [Paenibacillus taihuensis]REE68760.1 hypothetical protein A8990_13626 [Paenibacillus taihuensis]